MVWNGSDVDYNLASRLKTHAQGLSGISQDGTRSVESLQFNRPRRFR